MCKICCIFAAEMPQIKYICLLAILCLNAACSRHALHDAQTVVAQADSLWHAGQMYGIDQGDSSTLAQAYETLGKIPLPFREGLGFSYAHACYHYGRLLRKKGDPVSAMQVFINATHSHTRDYHILGRIYSNMGSICHLAGDFPLSYDMFERSSNMFLQNGDTINYYYALNDMALELAEQGKKDSTLNLIHEIEEQCTDKDVLNKTIETKAFLYRNIGQNKDAINIINRIQTDFPISPLTLTIKAQALGNLGIKDSALIYAKYIIDLPNASLQDKYNMYYIIIHGDTTLSSEDVKILSERRVDLELRNLVPLHKRCAQATQLLKQDIKQGLDWRWMYTIVAGLLFIIAFAILGYLWKKRKHHQQIMQDIQEKEQLQSILSHNIDDLSHIQENHHYAIVADLDKLCTSIHTNQDIKNQLCWNNYAEMCQSANRYMYNIIEHLQSYHLSEKETRLCILVLLKATTDQMVELIPYAKSGIGKFKYTTAQKLGTNTANMRSFILQLIG